MTTVWFGNDSLVHDSNTVLTVGTFDGVHCGHRSIIKSMHQAAAPKQSRTVVVTFHPHPQIVLQKPDRKPVRLLTTIEERLLLLDRLGVDTTVVLPFSREFASTPPEAFVRNVLVDSIGMHTIFIGHDHMFGKDRAGDEVLLQRIGSELGFAVALIPPQECNGVVVSSTRIREALNQARLEEANAMLGEPYQVTGMVGHGEERGRTLGTPTANIVLSNEHKLLPANGVYAVTAVVDGMEYMGVANIGVRPTFTTDTSPTLEVHLLDAVLDLYGKTMTVRFQRYLRGEQRFSSKESLMEQIRSDITNAQTFFQSHVVRINS